MIIMTKAYLRRNVDSMKHKLLEMSGSFVIGRAKAHEVNLCLLDVNVSRKHCEFKFNVVDQSWTVTDFSSNGVSVNGKRCQKSIAVSVVDGDEIILSDQKDIYNWTFCVGEVPEDLRRSDPDAANPPPPKRPKLEQNFDTQALEERVREHKRITAARMLRERKWLEHTVKLGEQKQQALINEKEILMSRLGEQIKLRNKQVREAREKLLAELEGKVDKDKIMGEFEEKIKIEKRKAEESQQNLLKEMEIKISNGERLRKEEVEERDKNLEKLRAEKQELTDKFEKEREDMNVELNQLRIKLTEENTSKESLKKDWESKMASVTSNLEDMIRKEKDDLERAINIEKLEKEALEKEVEALKTLNMSEVKKLEYELENERAVHAAVMESVKEEQEQKEEELRLKEQEIEERNKQNALLEQQMKDQLAELEKKKLEIENQMELVNASKNATNKDDNVDGSSKSAESLENELKSVAESEKVQADILGRLAESLEREYQCPTCLDLFISPVSLNCGHTYCWLCLAQWKNSNGRTRGDLGTCPECREAVRHENRVLAIDHMIDSIMEQLGEDKKKERLEKIEERKAEEEEFKKVASVAALATANRTGAAPSPVARGRGGGGTPGDRGRGHNRGQNNHNRGGQNNHNHHNRGGGHNNHNRGNNNHNRGGHNNHNNTHTNHNRGGGHNGHNRGGGYNVHVRGGGYNVHIRGGHNSHNGGGGLNSHNRGGSNNSHRGGQVGGGPRGQHQQFLQYLASHPASSSGVSGTAATSAAAIQISSESDEE